MAANQSVTVRLLAAQDRAAWEPLWIGYQRFYKVALPQATTDTTFARLLDPAEPMWCGLGLVDGRPLGIVHYIRHRTTWNPGDYCYLNDLFVSEEARGHGLGRALIEHVYAEAQAMGCSRVYWLTHETNETAQRLYDAVADRPGFIQFRKNLM
ncbi:N-acetyltransferase family protein [Ancylobacter crimeensis]